ncbi:hypothetical protein ACJX0J_018966, partial [Zea mays]
KMIDVHLAIFIGQIINHISHVNPAKTTKVRITIIISSSCIMEKRHKVVSVMFLNFIEPICIKKQAQLFNMLMILFLSWKTINAKMEPLNEKVWVYVECEYIG